MKYELPTRNGIDDDLPVHQNRFATAGRASANGRSAALRTTFLPIQSDMETQIHLIEQEAYGSVLRAFKAQSDAITWEKESLITELRKELRVSDEEHRELLCRVNADGIIRRIREWRASGCQPSICNSVPVLDPLPSPTVSESCKKQQELQSLASLCTRAPSQVLHQRFQPSLSSLKQGPVSGGRGKKPKSCSTGFRGTGPTPARGSGGSFGLDDSGVEANLDPLVGRKVWTRWPEDDCFYEAVIIDYNSAEGRHALVYDISTADETWEWVDLKEISPEDIQWEGEDPGVALRVCGGTGSGRGSTKTMSRGGSFARGRGRGIARSRSMRDFPPALNGIGQKALGDIKILHTNTLLNEVEKVFSASHPDPMDIEKAKKVLEEHEQALTDAIAMLEDASDGESDRREHQCPRGKSMDQERGWERQYYDRIGGQGNRILKGSDGSAVARGAKTASLSNLQARGVA